MPLFEVAIIRQPTRKERDEGTGTERLMYGPKAVMAKDSMTAAVAAMRSPDAPNDLDMTRDEVLIRPFA